MFKFTCQRYHCYITQIIDHLRAKETNQAGSADTFYFLPSTVGLGSKCKGVPKEQSLNHKQNASKNVNQLDQIFLCEIFKLNSSKQELINELSKNVDSSNVFEFLRLAANDSATNKTQYDAYWMIVYIFLKRTCGIDIIGSFTDPKIKKMLRSINLLEYTFVEGCLIYKPVMRKEEEKIDLTLLIRASMEISADKLQDFVVTNNKHNLTKVIRTRSEQGVFSDYPH